MTTLFLIFALTSSAIVYVITLRYFRAHPPTAKAYKVILLGVFLIQSAICVWIGFSLGQMSMR